MLSRHIKLLLYLFSTLDSGSKKSPKTQHSGRLYLQVAQGEQFSSTPQQNVKKI
jgi:hypothetical protein